MELRHSQVRVGEVSLHLVEAGPVDGPPVLLLHGFPEGWPGWWHQLQALAAAGYRALAPDQRGYGTSDRPAAVSAYRIDRLVADVLGLLDALGLPKVSLVAHDWGGAVAWTLVGLHPERFERFCVMNMPHPRVFARALLTSPTQLSRSWYVFAIQFPGLAEQRLRRDDFRTLVRVMFANTVNRPFGPEDIDRYKEIWSQPGCVSGMLAWYRAAFRNPLALAGARVPRIEVPTLMIWGKQDKALGFELAEPSLARCADGRLEPIEGAGHFVQHDAPERVNALLLDFLGYAP